MVRCLTSHHLLNNNLYRTWLKSYPSYNYNPEWRNRRPTIKEVLSRQWNNRSSIYWYKFSNNYLVFSRKYLKYLGVTPPPLKSIHDRPSQISDNVAAILVNRLQHLGYVVLCSQIRFHQKYFKIFVLKCFFFSL